MQTKIIISPSELSEMHPAYIQGATSNTLHHIINRRTTKRITTIVQKDGEWCEVRSNGGFQFEYDLTRFFSRTSCLEHILAQHNIQYNETVGQDDEPKEIITIHRRGKKQRDEFGFPISSRAHQFCEYLAACGSEGTTWADVKAADWNTDGAAFHWALSRLIKDNKALKKGKRFYLWSVIEKQPTTPIKSKSKLQPVAMPVKAKPVPIVIKKSKPKPV